MYSSCEILGFPDLGKVSKNRKANYMFTMLLKTDNFQLYNKVHPLFTSNFRFSKASHLFVFYFLLTEKLKIWENYNLSCRENCA